MRPPGGPSSGEGWRTLLGGRGPCVLGLAWWARGWGRLRLRLEAAGRETEAAGAGLEVPSTKPQSGEQCQRIWECQNRPGETEALSLTVKKI